MKHSSRYPQDWQAIALEVKEEADWRCEFCGLACIPPDVKIKGINRNLRAVLTLSVHHKNYIPEDNRRENLIALCSACHLRQHQRRHGSLPLGQMSLFGELS
ncbi:HNH endonuclease (plasmid) [[Synechococcus] sp. NIES-970]|uniref:HNH endonuclease n=1 Tax=Picosynechococcus sp. NKBG15041c TaxID=1407650 RepID=UPI00040FA5E7|nr:hypothetical protein [Picosynechococcus sp. NKBG15041c]BAW97824.1 HNH endonuclease [[Synechococcus] sp. NIES-970]